MKVGIVGLPNAGKSTLFNAITKAGAQVGNYPFTTIDKNVGVAVVPDDRLRQICDVMKSEKMVSTTVCFVDIAGLIRGASKGEGLGNQFLGHIREVDAIAHVVRCFEDKDIIHVDGTIDPARDIEVVGLELILADLQTVENRLDKVKNQSKSGAKEAKDEYECLELLEEHLQKNQMACLFSRIDEMKSLNLLTSKPVIYIANVSEDDLIKGNLLVDKVNEIAKSQGSEVIIISAKVESEIAELEKAEADIFLKELGLNESGLDRIIHASYHLLGLITFFTAGPNECRAWTIFKGTSAGQAAGKIHTDFERGFIKAEVVYYEDLVKDGSFAVAREKGHLRLEGKEYIVNDGDVITFKFNV